MIAVFIILPTIFLLLGLVVGYNAGYASARRIGRWPDPSRVREILERRNEKN